MKNGGLILWNVTAICETFKISCLMGKLHARDVLEKPFKGPIITFGSLVEYYTISAKDQSRIHQFGKKVLPGLFLGYATPYERRFGMPFDGPVIPFGANGRTSLYFCKKNHRDCINSVQKFCQV